MTEVELPEVLDQRGAQNMAEQLLAHQGNPISINAATIRRLGAIGVEMLLSAHRQWREDNVAFVIHDWSDDALKALSVLGVDPLSLHVAGQQ